MFLCSAYKHSSGGSSTYVFAPPGTQRFTFRDPAEKPLPDLTVFLRRDQRTWSTNSAPHGVERTTDKNGVVLLENVPVSARFDISSRDTNWAVRDVAATPAHLSVRYAVTVVRSATITGRLRASNGNPLGGYYAFATSNPDVAASRRQTRYGSGVTGKSGRFRIVGLLPGTYYVGARSPLRSDRSVTSTTRRVTVASGQTVDAVELVSRDDVGR